MATFQEATQTVANPFASVDFSAAGNLYKPSSIPSSGPSARSVYQTGQDYIQALRNLADAQANQRQIDSVYKQVMNSAPPRDVEVLPPEDPASAFNADRLRSARPPDEMPPDLSSAIPPPKATTAPSTPQTIDVTPAPAEPPTPFAAPDAPGALPSNIPEPAPSGLVGASAVGGLLDTAGRIVSGQPVDQAILGGAGTATGGVIGGTIGSLADPIVGPLGTFGGQVIGSWLGGKISDAIYHLFRPLPAVAPTPTPTPALTTPFTGGQSPGVKYKFGYYFTLTRSNGGVDWIGENDTRQFATAYGPLGGAYVKDGNAYITIGDANGNPKPDEIAGATSGISVVSIQGTLHNISRADGLPDTGGNPAPAPYPQNNAPPRIIGQQNDPNPPPAAFPGGYSTPNAYNPSNLPSGGTPRGDGASSGWMPHGYPAPGLAPSPDASPQNLGGNLPSTGSSNPTPSAASTAGPAGQPTPAPPDLAIPPNTPNLSGTTPDPLPLINLPNAGSHFSPSPYSPLVSPPIPSGMPSTKQSTPIPNGLKAPQPQPQPPNYSNPDNQCQTDSCIAGLQQKAQSMDDRLKKLEDTISSMNQNFLLLNQNITNQTKTQQPQECYAAVPDWWQVRVEGKRPQMVFLFAVDLGNGNLDYAKYPITIPYPIVKKYQTSPLPPYKKGQYEGMLILNDNSKVFVNAFDEDEANKMLDAAAIIIQPQYLQGSNRKVSQRKGEQMLQVNVVPKRLEYFSEGTKTKSDWIVEF